MLRNCTIETRLGAVYVFPDMATEVDVPVGSGLNSSETNLTMINVSGACLVLPWRIIKQIKMDEQVIWTGPEVYAV